MGGVRTYIGLMVVAGLATTCSSMSCEKAEKVATPTERNLPTASLTGQGDADIAPDGEALTEITDLHGPQDFIAWLEAAYNRRDAGMLACILADEYICTEITRGGIRSWDKETEIRIHQRMFNPRCEVKPVESFAVSLENMTVERPPAGSWSTGIWIVRCGAHVVLDYVDSRARTFEFVGPAEFHIRRNPDSPCGWELVAWHDQPPHRGER